MDFTAIDEAIRLKQQMNDQQEQQQQEQQQLQKRQQQQDQGRSDSSLELFKIIRKRQWDDRMRRKFAQSTLNQIAADRKIKYISTIRSNPYIDRTVIFNQFTSNVIQAASATILDNEYQETTTTRRNNNDPNNNNNPNSYNNPYNRPNMNALRFNLNRNEMNLLNQQQQQQEANNIDSSGLFRVGSSSLNNKFDIVIPTGVVLPPIKTSYTANQYQPQPEHESVFDRLNPKYVIKKNRISLSKVAYIYAILFPFSFTYFYFSISLNFMLLNHSRLGS